MMNKENLTQADGGGDGAEQLDTLRAKLQPEKMIP
jgi:hypothetical protein